MVQSKTFSKSLIIKDAGETAGVSRGARQAQGHWPGAGGGGGRPGKPLTALLNKRLLSSKLPVVPASTSLDDLSSCPNSENKTCNLILFVFREHLQGSEAPSGSENLHGLLVFTALHLRPLWPGMRTAPRKGKVPRLPGGDEKKILCALPHRLKLLPGDRVRKEGPISLSRSTARGQAGRQPGTHCSIQ